MAEITKMANQLQWTGKGPLDAKFAPVATKSNLPGKLQAFNGQTIYVNDEACEYWFFGGSWVKKVPGLSLSIDSAGTLSLKADGTEISGSSTSIRQFVESVVKEWQSDNYIVSGSLITEGSKYYLELYYNDEASLDDIRIDVTALKDDLTNYYTKDEIDVLNSGITSNLKTWVENQGFIVEDKDHYIVKGTVVNKNSEDKPGSFIKFEYNDELDPIYIDVASLSGGSAAIIAVSGLSYNDGLLSIDYEALDYAKIASNLNIPVLSATVETLQTTVNTVQEAIFPEGEDSLVDRVEALEQDAGHVKITGDPEEIDE